MTLDDPRTGRGGDATRRLLIAAGFTSAAVAAVVLYAMKAQDGKDLAGAAVCPGARAKAAAIRPMARGELTALSVSSDPRPLPELKFKGPDGAAAGLADFRGRTVLLNLWATWCVPCRQEMPALDRLQEKRGGPDFAVVAVNIDTTKLDRPKAFLTENGIRNLGFYSDSTAEVFEVLKGAGKAIGLPTTLVIDKNGCELGAIAGPAKWDSPEALDLLAAAKG
jgi:thiol-disulfide isomerase/thioredoxin